MLAATASRAPSASSTFPTSHARPARQRAGVDLAAAPPPTQGDSRAARAIAGVYSYCAAIGAPPAPCRMGRRRARSDRGAARPVVLAIAGGAVLLLTLLGLRLLPSPRSSPADLCASSPTPGACRALVNRGHAAGPELQVRQDLGAAAPAHLLLAGLDALASGNPVTAHRLCADAAREEGLDRSPALVCQGRAALRLGWPARAAYLAQRALELQDDAAAHVLAGDALEAQRDCRGARVEYLRALDLEPDNAAAAEGIRRCGGAAPPAQAPRDLTGDRDAEVPDALA